MRTGRVQTVTGFEGSSGWPEGLSDAEAVQRLRTLCLGACDGVQDLADDTRYKALRRALMNRTDLRPLAPSFVAAQANLETFVRHVRETRDRSQRRDMVRSAFEPLQNAITGDEGTSSAAWTGRRSLGEQAALVRKLAPAALEAVGRLIAEEERARDNGGPVDPERDDALAQLRSLHGALGELIRLARASVSLEPALIRLRAIGRGARETLGRIAAAAPVTGSVMLVFGTVAGIADMLAGSVAISVAAGTLAGTAVKDGMLKAGGKQAS